MGVRFSEYKGAIWCIQQFQVRDYAGSSFFFGEEYQGALRIRMAPSAGYYHASRAVEPSLKGFFFLKVG